MRAPGKLTDKIMQARINLFAAFRGPLPPDGRPEGSGFRFGHHFVLAANLLAVILFIFPFFHHLIEQPNVVLVLSKIAIASGYIAVAGWAVGFSLIYQPALSKK